MPPSRIAYAAADLAREIDRLVPEGKAGDIKLILEREPFDKAAHALKEYYGAVERFIAPDGAIFDRVKYRNLSVLTPLSIEEHEACPIPKKSNG